MADQVDSSSTSSNDTTSATERVTPNSEKNIGTINRTFRIPSHGESVLQALNKQRSGGEFCDVTVLVEHKRFSAHKCVLSANSEYFRSLLCTDNDGVFLRHVTASSFQAILDFMYTSRLQLEPNSVQNILTTAKFLQVKGVISICCRYLESQIRSLAKDLDGRKKKLKNPAVISVDAEVFKEKELPMLSTLQQQPQINYNSVTGTFGPAAPTAQNLIRGPHPQLFPFQTPPINSQSNGLNGPAYQRTTLPLVVHGQTSEMVHHDQRHHMLPWKNVHDPQQTQNPYGNNIHTNPTSYQIPFSIAHNQARQAPMMYSHGKYNPNHPLYTAQSTGGKGRRQHPQNRRKPNYGAVSETNSLKCAMVSPQSIVDPSLRASRIPKDKNNTQNKTNNPVYPDILLSSSRRKIGSSDKRISTPDSVAFTVEAEDRYWKSLSGGGSNSSLHQLGDYIN